MRATKIRLQNFRNYARAELLPDARMTVLTGQNAQGKTNVLEALHLCCLGRSHRTSHDRELIRWGEGAAHVAVEVKHLDGTHDVSITLSREERRRKTVRVGGTQVARIGELMGHVNGVLFAPEDLSIVKEGPSERRHFIDMELSQLRPAYFYALQRYVRALNQRNNLLREMQRRPALKSTLDAWDEQLALAGAEVVCHRRDYIEKLKRAASESHSAIAGGAEALEVSYVTQVKEEEHVDEALMKRLFTAREEDIRRATTTVGPHRDDLRLTVSGKDVRVFGSQGQQRTVVLSLKLAELAVVEEERGETPILMLDDVMSELDPHRRQQLIERIGRVQTIVTCTDLSDLAGAEKGAIYRVEAGRLTRES